MLPDKINERPDFTRELHLIEGGAKTIKSPYYQQLVKYTRSLLRTLNGPNLTPDLENYCYQQLWLTKVEMERWRKAFLVIIIDPTPPGAA